MPRTRSQATLDKVAHARSLLEADPSITQTALASAVKRMFGTGLNFSILSNLMAGRDPFEKRARKREDPDHGPRYGGLFVIGGEKSPPEAADPLASSPEYLVIAAGRRTGCRNATEVESAVAKLLESGTGIREIAVYRRRPIRVRTTYAVKMDGPEEDLRVRS